jgi:hypothetical protein
MISEFLLVDARVNLGRAANVWGHLLKRCYPTLGDDLSKSLTACLMRGHRNQSGNYFFHLQKYLLAKQTFRKSLPEQDSKARQSISALDPHMTFSPSKE